MKKIVALLVACMLTITAIFALVACTPKEDPAEVSATEAAIIKAQSMTLQELEEASKAEMAANPNAKFNADSLTSGVKKALAKFQEKYDWITENNSAYNSKKGSEYQPKLIAAQQANQYIADMVMIQDASFLKNAMLDTGFLLSYTPSGEGYQIGDGDKNPQVGVTFNKVFMYNNTVVDAEGGKQLTNVWQLTGKDGANGKKGLTSKVSFQNPLGEDINMSFLIMLTSPAACEKLTSAYQSYFGTAYNGAEDDYQNIGYKFVAEFLANYQTHASDTSEVKAIGTYTDGHVMFAGLCKLKDYQGYKDAGNAAAYLANADVTAGGWNNQIEGFNGFVYNMWMLIPKTANLPYTACLFIRYMLGEEGYNAGWGGILGYYSANQLIPSADGIDGLDLATWKNQCIVEDVNYIDSAYKSAVKFINLQLTK